MSRKNGKLKFSTILLILAALALLAFVVWMIAWHEQSWKRAGSESKSPLQPMLQPSSQAETSSPVIKPVSRQPETSTNMPEFVEPAGPVVSKPLQPPSPEPLKPDATPAPAAPSPPATPSNSPPLATNRVPPSPAIPSEVLPARPTRKLGEDSARNSGETNGWPRSVLNVLETQIALARQALSPGSIDGVFGSQTRLALQAFQLRTGLPQTGELDRMTRSNLFLTFPVEEAYQITTNDLSRLQPLSSTWLGKSQQTELAYETLLESLAERRRSSPALLRRMNPGFDWTNAVPGSVVKLPSMPAIGPKVSVSLIRIKLAARTLAAYDSGGALVAHFPCSIARKVEKRPVGTLHVVNIAAPPNYLFDPDNFPESAEARTLGRKLMLPPGPNNPVGLAWIGLDRPGYGIHGTPHPEEIGRTESHGCFRLANWNAEYLARSVRAGVVVEVEP